MRDMTSCFIQNFGAVWTARRKKRMMPSLATFDHYNNLSLTSTIEMFPINCIILLFVTIRYLLFKPFSIIWNLLFSIIRNLLFRITRNLLFKLEAIEYVECIVCCEQVPSDQIIFCNNFDFNKPGPSKIDAKLKDEEEKEHLFCNDCIFGHASAAVGDIPLAKGGIGLRCMMPKCDNPILYSEIRMLLSNDLQTKLEERMLQESIGMALVVNLERCKKCNFAIEMEDDKNINKVFDCLDCGYKMCRLCEGDWDDEHFGLSCKELEEKRSKDKIDRVLEKQMNDAIVRKCPRCGIQFVKLSGCNKMTCRCGMKQCYICRESGIGYDHFCPHLRDPLNPRCKECNMTCLLHEDPEKKDEQLIKEIRERGVTDVENMTTMNDKPVNVPVANQLIRCIISILI